MSPPTCARSSLKTAVVHDIPHKYVACSWKWLARTDCSQQSEGEGAVACSSAVLLTADSARIPWVCASFYCDLTIDAP